MKNHHFRPLIGLAVLAIYCLFTSCTSSTTLEILQPAEMAIPDHIEVIATVDRSKPEKGWSTALEGLFTGENIGQDKAGRQRAIEGLTNMLTRTPRFLVRHTGMEYTGSKGGGSYAPPLPWSEIEDICNRYNADAVVAIEKFDSDNSVSTNQVERKSKDKDGNEIIKKVFNSEVEAGVQLGWRFYDLKNRVILDEYSVRRSGRDNAEGKTEQEALNNLTNQTRIVEDISYGAGQDYGMRIAPVWITVSRAFYKSAKGDAKDSMERAFRMARGDSWDKAAAIWNEIINGAYDEKTKGRAAHNLAVASEREGKLDTALSWAKKAYTRYGNKSDRRYIQTIERRISDQRRVESQMGRK